MLFFHPPVDKSLNSALPLERNKMSDLRYAVKVDEGTFFLLKKKECGEKQKTRLFFVGHLLPPELGVCHSLALVLLSKLRLLSLQ